MHTIKWMAGIGLTVALTACGNAECDKLGEHMADVIMKEAKDGGLDVATDKRDAIVKKTVEACNAQPPEQEALDCALKAESSAAMLECEAKPEEG